LPVKDAPHLASKKALESRRRLARASLEKEALAFHAARRPHRRLSGGFVILEVPDLGTTSSRRTGLSRVWLPDGAK
jgi:hypothetical protein